MNVDSVENVESAESAYRGLFISFFVFAVGYVSEEFAFDPFFEGSFSESAILGNFYSFACVEAYRQFVVDSSLLFCQFAQRA